VAKRLPAGSPTKSTGPGSVETPGVLTVLGIDTSLRSTGLGVLAGTPQRQQALHYEVVKNPQKWPHSRCVQHLHERLSALIERYQPDVAAIEGIFYCKNVKVAIALGEARGAALCACASAGLSVYEYAPRLVKKGVVGSGKASKEQVAHMVKAILGLDHEPPPDAADALAIAMCHLTQTRHGGKLGEQSEV